MKGPLQGYSLIEGGYAIKTVEANPVSNHWNYHTGRLFLECKIVAKIFPQSEFCVTAKKARNKALEMK